MHDATSRSAGDRALAAEVWRSLFHVFVSTRWQRDAVLARLELTPNDAKALNTLDAVEGKPMRALAQAWGTDASAATWVVDRLERKGLAERRAQPGDRRVKLVVLTPLGVQTRDEILRAFHEPPPELLALSRAELESLGEGLGKLAAAIPAHPVADEG
ncbi:MAG TPA: MarR family transcriptional regulator [Longimicrobium sp.]|nr:MarR family transcriptional regulator [Longimicrobium sp.]